MKIKIIYGVFAVFIMSCSGLKRNTFVSEKSEAPIVFVETDEEYTKYEFRPFAVKCEDGFYEVLTSNEKYPFKEVILAEKPVVSKNEIENVKSIIDDHLGLPAVSIELNKQGTIKFEQATERNTGKAIAIVIDQTVISMPIVNGKISDGKVQISGNFTMEEVNEIVKKLGNK